MIRSGHATSKVGGRRGWRNWRESERKIRIGKDGGRETEMNRITK